MTAKVPLFAEQLRNGTVKLKQSETLYTLWIGTNDLCVLYLPENAIMFLIAR